ncbi:acylphosphatase [Agromyces sp. MMS24-JH15]|uniref:acylphosphatase n=1 Tax=Agromyces sp. MMS24-JH15 TaxID=3243765 RepID=UPI0037485DF6
MIRRRIIVRGRVQGVGYRYSARREAERLAIVGWIRNLRDGDVEAEIEGDEASVAAMLDWFAVGPIGSSVTSTEVTDLPAAGDRGFRITY